MLLYFFVQMLYYCKANLILNIVNEEVYMCICLGTLLCYCSLLIFILYYE